MVLKSNGWTKNKHRKFNRRNTVFSEHMQRTMLSRLKHLFKKMNTVRSNVEEAEAETDENVYLLDWIIIGNYHVPL